MPDLLAPTEQALRNSWRLLPGQWWERMGYVVFLPHGLDPNSDPMFQGWVQVTQDRAREVLESHAKDDWNLLPPIWPSPAPT